MVTTSKAGKHPQDARTVEQTNITKTITEKTERALNRKGKGVQIMSMMYKGSRKSIKGKDLEEVEEVEEEPWDEEDQGDEDYHKQVDDDMDRACERYHQKKDDDFTG